jgi:hypothetical protein
MATKKKGGRSMDHPPLAFIGYRDVATPGEAAQ